MAWFPAGPVLHLSAFFIYIVLIAIILNRNNSAYSNRSAAFLLSLFALWSFGKMFLHNPGTPFEAARFIERMDAIAWSSFPVVAFTFMISLTNLRPLLAKKWFYILAAIPPIFFICLHWAGLLMSAPERTPYGWLSVWKNNSFLPYIYYAYYLGVTLTGIFILVNRYFESYNPINKKQYSVIILTTTFTLILGTLFEVVLPILKVPLGMFEDITNIYILVWATGIFFVIFRYRFMALTPSSAAESIIVSMNEALILVDDEIKINYANKNTLSMLGYRESHLSGSSFSSIFYDSQVYNTLIKNVIKNSIYKNNELLLKKHDGSALPCIFSASIVKELGEMRGIVCIVTDITEQKLAQKDLKESYDKLKELDTLKSNFTSMVSHELRTPITSIKGFLAFLMAGVGGPVTEKQRDFLTTIKSNSDRLLTLINDLLDTAKMESGSFSIRKEPCNLINVITTAIKDVNSISEKKKIQVINSSSGPVCLINADEYRVSQALINLINNAIKFSQPGSKINITAELKEFPEIRIPEYAAAPEVQSGRFAVITVSDKGQGLNMENLMRIFDRFYQVEHIDIRSAQGTGLGLNIVQNIAKLHGGTVWAESEGLGHGSSFIIILPRN